MNINSLNNRIALITGGNSGIGRTTALELARNGAYVFIACRDAEKAQSVIDEFSTFPMIGKIEYLSLDLSDLNSVKDCAKTFLAKGLPLHLLINNAGIAGLKGLTAQGFEMTMGVNHLGHFLLTQELLPALLGSAPSRIVNVASRAHFYAKGIDFDSLRSSTATRLGVKEYCESKLANILFTRELAKRLKGTGVSTYAVHPGVVASSLWREVPEPVRSLMKLFMVSNKTGAKTTLHCATSSRTAFESGDYYSDCKSKKPSKIALDINLANELWTRSSDWVNNY
jgi:NAD(P)-dependent dehydrogenase (short-subunit alcohol dehydrogenase family)